MTENAYRDAGVDIDLEATAIKALINNLSFKRKGNYTMLGNVGHFAGLIDFGPRRSPSPPMAWERRCSWPTSFRTGARSGSTASR